MEFKIVSQNASAALTLDGAALKSLKKDDTEYLWQGNPEYWSGQAPVCFPITGVLPDGKGTAFGKPCNMKRHGVARITPFKVFEQLSDSITFVQNSNDETKASYPFDYQLKIKYTINDSTVTTQYIITNTGKENMPFTIGGHPAFNCPIDKNEDFTDYKVIFDKPIDSECLRPDHHTGLVDTSKKYDVMKGSDTLEIRHSLFEENDALIFHNIVSKSVKLIGKNNKGIKVDFQDMANLLIWSAENNAPFVALEPWTGISSCIDESGKLEEKPGVTILQSGETVSYEFKITMF